MKLAKLSLAAIMAVGALSTANAQPLEEAIKGVDFTGMVRYRMDDVNQGTTNTNVNDWDYLGKFTAPVTSNLKAVAAFASAGGASDNHSAGPAVANVDLRKMFFVYKQDALTVKAGLQSVSTLITDGGFNGDKGNGVVAMYNAGPVTLAAAYYGNTNAAGGEDVTAAAAIGSFGPVNAQVWYVGVDNVLDSSLGLDLKAKVAGVSLQGQVFQTKLADEVLAPLAEDSGMFYALKAGYSMDNFSINAGYLKNDDDQGTYSITSDGGGQIMPGWRMIYHVDNEASAESMFVDVGAKFGKVGAKLGYAVAEFDAAKNSASDADEIWGMVSYKYAKNFNTYIKYSVMSYDAAGIDDKEHMRFEAKYSF